MFRGQFEHTVDDKGRVAIPARFRQDLDSSPLIVTYYQNCLLTYPLPEWEILENKIESLPQFDPKVMAFQRYFLSGATECPLDKAGRILLPANLRESSRIAHDCVIIGRVKKFEIWSKEAWAHEKVGLQAQFESITTSMTQLGINL